MPHKTPKGIHYEELFCTLCWERGQCIIWGGRDQRKFSASVVVSEEISSGVLQKWKSRGGTKSSSNGQKTAASSLLFTCLGMKIRFYFSVNCFDKNKDGQRVSDFLPLYKNDTKTNRTRALPSCSGDVVVLSTCPSDSAVSRASDAILN